MNKTRERIRKEVDLEVIDLEDGTYNVRKNRYGDKGMLITKEEFEMCQQEGLRIEVLKLEKRQ